MINREEIVEFLKQEVAPLLNTLRVVDKTKVEKRGNPHLIVFPVNDQGLFEFVEERESFQDPEDWYFDSSAYDEYIQSLPDLWEKEYAAPLRQAIFRQLNTTYAGKADTYFNIEVETEGGLVFVSLKPAAYRNLFPNSRTASYKDDPRWIAAKFAGIDANGNPFRKGQQVLYYPRTKTILTGKEADKAWREFEALSFDEDFSRFASSKTTTPPQWRSPMRRMSSTDVPLDPRKAVVYFDLSFEEYNLEEDLDNIYDINDRNHLALLALYQENAEKTIHRQEDEALKYLSRLFGARIGNEGHDSGGNLVCKISVDSYEDVVKISKAINQHHIGGDDQIDAGTYYFTAQGFTLYPQGVNGPRFSEDSRDDGTIEEWLEDNGPRARRASYAYSAKRRAR